ncbi:MAG: antibiotic biosynthesis monooxygenase [Lachnospiraceae bacterium]|nr:antibiotic biosynthesis monooxygenase [Lachnospiraceae bacterium]
MKLLVIYTVKDGQKQTYFEALEASGAPDKVRAEDGCLQYEYRPEEGPENELHLYEEWASPEHQKVHMTQPHMKDIIALKDRFVTETKLIRL